MSLPSALAEKTEHSKDTFEFYAQRDSINAKHRHSTAPLLYENEKANENTARHRKMLVLWLKYVSSSMNFSNNTFFLAINIFDRYCKACVLKLENYELFGLVALHIAAKYLETKVPSLCSHESFSSAHILDAERQILSKLEFELTVPTIYTSMVLLSNKLNIPPGLVEFSEKLLLESVAASSDLESNTIEAAASLLLFTCNQANAKILFNQLCEILNTL